MLKPARIDKFKGLQNVSDPLRLGLGWLQKADNVYITDTGAVRVRNGYEQTLAGTRITGAFSTIDFKRTYIVDAGELKRVLPDAAGTVMLRSGFSDAPMYWAQANDQVYYSNGPDKGIINADDSVKDWSWTEPTAVRLAAGTGSLPPGQYQVSCTYVLPDGRETGAAEATTIQLDGSQSLVITDIPLTQDYRTRVYIAPANSPVFQLAFTTTWLSAFTWNSGPNSLGEEMLFPFKNPPPADATQVAYWKGRMHLMEYVPQVNATIVWSSEPLAWHLFQMNSDFVVVPGKGTLLAPTDNALIIGTDLNIHSYDGAVLRTEAPYGAVPGWGWAAEADGSILLWTVRGLCAALPFVNLTDRQVSVAPGVRAGAALVQQGGQKQFVVALHRGGEAFNSRS